MQALYFASHQVKVSGHIKLPLTYQETIDQLQIPHFVKIKIQFHHALTGWELHEIQEDG